MMTEWDASLIILKKRCKSNNTEEEMQLQWWRRDASLIILKKRYKSNCEENMQVSWWRRYIQVSWWRGDTNIMVKKIYKSYDDYGMRCKSNNTEEEMQGEEEMQV